METHDFKSIKGVRKVYPDATEIKIEHKPHKMNTDFINRLLPGMKGVRFILRIGKRSSTFAISQMALKDYEQKNK